MPIDPKNLPAVTESTLPAKPPRVELDVEPAMTDDQLTRALREYGGIQLSANNLNQLRQIGIKLKGLGVTHIQRGSVMIDQAKCDEALDALRKAITERVASNKPKGLTVDLARLAQAYAVLAGKKTDMQRLSLEIEQAVAPSGAPVEEEGGPIAGFIPGRRIVPTGGTLVIGQTVNLNGAAEPPPKSGS